MIWSWAQARIARLKTAWRLRTALRPGNTQALLELIADGVDVNSVVGGRSLLHYAMARNDKAVLAALMKGGALVGGKDATWIIYFAALHKNYEVLKYAISQGADINDAPPWALTPIELAISTHDVELLEFVLANGATKGEFRTMQRHRVSTKMCRILEAHGWYVDPRLYK